MGKISYVVIYGENTAVTKSLEVAHTFTLRLIETGYAATYERVESE